MKVIFLDFDGVIVPNGRFNAERNNGTEFDRGAVRRVSAVAKQTNAHVVISSMWRVYHSIYRLRRWLFDAGLEAPVVGITPDYDYRLRANEIDAYVRAHEITNFVIIDDARHAGYLSPSRFVHVNSETLFSHDNARSACGILGEYSVT